MIVLSVRLSTGGVRGWGWLWGGGGRGGRRAGLELFAGEAEAALAALVFLHGRGEFGFREIGPQHRRENHLRVGTLHEEEIAEAGFAGGADEQVGVGDVGGVEIAAERRPGGVARFLAPGGDSGGVGAGGIGQLDTRTVVKRENKIPVREVPGGLDGVFQLPAGSCGQFLEVAAARLEESRWVAVGPPRLRSLTSPRRTG